MSEFIRILKITDILALQAKRRMQRNITAHPSECVALAQRFNLEAIHTLAAEVNIYPWNESGVRINGTLNADVTERCVISLRTFEQRVRENFISFFMTQSTQHEDANFGASVHIEEPEDIPPDGIDIGELVAQQLSLALAPYPHLPGAKLPESTSTTQKRKSPFAILQRQ